jgi:iron complex transport system substrate-binding protein
MITLPYLKTLFFLTFVLLAHPAQAKSEQTLEPLPEAARERIVVLGTAVGELVYALGLGDAVVARDLSCEFPEAIQEKPAVGYFRQLSTEGVLSQRPSLILGTAASGPPNVVEQLRQSGVPIHLFDDQPDLESLRRLIREMGELLDRSEQAESLIAQLDADLATVPTVAEEAKPTVLFLLSPPGSDRLLAAGRDTAATAMIELAGGRNLFADFAGYKPLSPEVIASRRPDVILLPGRDGAVSVEEAGGHAVVRGLVAAGHSRIVEIDLAEKLAFGLRTGEAARALHARIYE